MRGFLLGLVLCLAPLVVAAQEITGPIIPLPVPVSAGGTNCAAASITCFNNITGYTAAGATGTTSTNLVFSASPTGTGTWALPIIQGTSIALGGCTIGASTICGGAAALSGVLTINTTTLTGGAANLLTLNGPLTTGGALAVTGNISNSSGSIFTPSDRTIGWSGATELDTNNTDGILRIRNSGHSSAASITVGASALLTFSGPIGAALTSDATHTDATVCRDTTSGQFYAGSGAVGICLGTSSLRYKDHVETLEVGLPAILALRAISYRYKPGFGTTDRDLYGFAAEEVAKVLPKLVANDNEGRPNSVDWAGMVPVLVNAVQEQQAKIEELEARIEILEATQPLSNVAAR